MTLIVDTEAGKEGTTGGTESQSGEPQKRRATRSSEFYAAIGRKGGEARKKKLGEGGYRELGRKGGEARKSQLGEGGYSNLGRRGGEAVKERYGADFYSAIGRKGGQAVSQDRTHMAEIGRKGGEARSTTGETGHVREPAADDATPPTGFGVTRPARQTEEDEEGDVVAGTELEEKE